MFDAMKEKIQEKRRKACAFFLALFLTTLCVVTYYNTYRLLKLTNEIDELNVKFVIFSATKIQPRNTLNSEYDQNRTKRSIIGATEDGILVSSETYSQHKRHNHSRSRYPGFKGLSVTALPARPSYFGSYSSVNSVTQNIKGGGPKKSPVNIRTSRVMHFEDKSKAFRQVVKKSDLKSLDSASASNEYSIGSSESEFPIIRDEGIVRTRNRQRMEVLDERHPRTGRVKPLPAIHLSGDTSRYVYGTHENFNGNGHLRHLQKTFVDWKPNSWVEKTGMNAHFTYDEGYLTIKESGIYFVYAQIYYLDEHDRNGYRVYKNADSILQCTVSSHTTERIQKGNTCYTAGLEYLAEGDRISLGDLADGRYSLFEPGKSFFGAIKLGDVRART